MADMFSAGNERELRSRKGHDMSWSCDTHGEPIKFFCEEHNIAICHPCATKDHQKPCHLFDIENVIFQRGQQMDLKSEEIGEAMARFEDVNIQIKSCKVAMVTHLMAVTDAVNEAYNRKLSILLGAEEEEIRIINKNVDEEVRIINEKRDRLIKVCQDKRRQWQEGLEDTMQKLTSDCEEMGKLVQKLIADVENRNQHAIKAMRIVEQTMKRLRETDKDLVNGAPQAIASLNETLSTINAEESIESLLKIQQDLEGAEFLESTRYGHKHFGVIHGNIGKWEKVKEIPPFSDSQPRVVGLISDDEVCVSDESNDDLYVIHFGDGHAKKLLEGGSSITSCAPINSNTIRLADVKGRVTLYDRERAQWKELRNIAWRGSPDSPGYVDVNRDGMILEGKRGQSDILVVNPADGEISQTISLKDGTVYKGICSLPSGNVMVRTKGGCIISNSSGEIISVDSNLSWFSDYHCITSSGDKVGREGLKIFVYQKKFSL